MSEPLNETNTADGQSRSTVGLGRGLPEYVTTGFSRAEWHDQAWALYQSKTFHDTMLAKASIHTIRAVFDATFDALMAKRSNATLTNTEGVRVEGTVMQRNGGDNDAI